MKGEEVGRAQLGPRGASRAWGRVCTGFQRRQETLEGRNPSASWGSGYFMGQHALGRHC